MKIFELAYYEDGVLIVERYEATTKMEARGFVVRRFKRQVNFEYVTDITEQYQAEMELRDDYS